MKFITWNSDVLLFTGNSVYSIRFPGFAGLVRLFNLRQYYWNMLVRAPLLWRYWRLRARLTPCGCGYVCAWVYPYGFVPEAECPVHDK